MAFRPVLVFLIALLSGFMYCSAFTQTEHLTVDDGLSQNFISKIFQDSRGFIWIGTKDGLNRYDGKNFVVYRHDPYDFTSLSDNTVSTIFEDAENVLWIGTVYGGVNKFDRATERFTRYSVISSNESSQREKHVISMSEGANNTLWICTTSGVSKLDKNKGIIQRFPSPEEDPENLIGEKINQVYEDDNGVSWLGASNAPDIIRIDRSKNPMVITRIRLMQDFPKIQNYGLRGIIPGAGNGFIIVLPNVIVSFDTNRQTVMPLTKLYPREVIRKAIQDKEKNFWITTGDFRLLFYDVKNNSERTIFETSPHTITSGFCVDNSENIWLPTNGFGIFKVNSRALKFGSSPGNFLELLYEKELTAFSDYGMNIRDILSRRANRFVPILKDSKGNTWLFLQSVFRLDAVSGTIRKFQYQPTEKRDLGARHIQFFFEDREDKVWAFAKNGEGTFDEPSGKFIYHRFISDSMLFSESLLSYGVVLCAYQDKQGIFWLGTQYFGLLRYDPESKTSNYFQHRSYDRASLSNNHVLTICEDPSNPENILWIGTDGGGLNCFDKASGTFTHYTDKDGLPNNVVYGILSDAAGNLWMSTNKGICRFNPSEGTFRTYDVNDGMQSNEFNRMEYFKSTSGEMFFGGINGYNHFYPENITDNSVSPSIEFTDFKLSYKSVLHNVPGSPLKQSLGETKSIVLDYSQNMFTLEFAALDFTSPEKNQYAYMLEGLENSWTYEGTFSSATYTNISPGKYVFRVKGANNDGVWNEQGASIEIIIVPPFWMTWWFRGFVIVVFLSVGPIIYYRRVTTLKREKRIKENFSRQLLITQEEERKRVANELHDSLGQNLIIAKNQSELGLMSANDFEKTKDNFRQVSETISEVLLDVRNISHNLYPYQLERLGLTDALKSMFKKIQEQSLVVCATTIEPLVGLFSKDAEINVYRVVQEAVNNILKHSHATNIQFTAIKDISTLRIVIADNGKGFVTPQESTEQAKLVGIGISNMRNRVNLLHGTLLLTSLPDVGTRIEIEIPVQFKDYTKEKQ